MKRWCRPAIACGVVALLSGCALWPAGTPPQASVSLSHPVGIARPAWLAEKVAAMDAAAYGAPIRLRLSYELTPPAALALAQAGGPPRPPL